FVYLTYLGGSGANLATSLAVDAAGTAWVAGSTSSRDFPVTEKAVQTAWKEGQCSTSGLGFTSSFPCNDGFALAVNPAGNALAYSTFLGGSRNDVVYGIGIDAQGDPWIAGGTTSPDFPVAGLLFQRGLSGSQDAFVAHMDPRAGKLLASWYLGGSGTDYATRLALDSAGNVYIAGSTGSADFPVSNGALQPEYGGGTDLFLVKLLPDSSMPVYATYFGGENGEVLNDLAVDATGNAYLAGAVSEMPISLSEGIVWISNPHGLLAKIDPHGAATLYNNQVLDTVSSIAVDSQGRVTALGRKIFNAPFTADAISTCNTTGSFLLRLEADGKTVRYGSSAWGNEVAIAASDAVYLAGATSMEKQDFSRNPSMAATCVLGATEFMASAVAPGEIVSIYGRSLGPAEGVAASYDVSGRLPFRLGEVSVSFDGTVAPLLYVQANQINAVVPFAAAGRRSSSVVVTYNGNSTSATVSMADASNIIMQANGAIAAINEDGSINSKDHPARKGSIVTIFSSGGGQTNPPSVDGQIATAPALLVLPVKVLIGSASPVPAEVLYAGAAPGLLAGTVQVNFRVPANLPDSPVSPGYPNQNVALIIGGDQTSYSTSGAIFVE
ncbi:MAG TPA: SBBP repeat-containing protein, partial [Bryobacteraceae bacterium]|nr:SBBP repeat-containing protein [Bryobacteraceae bacterium]